jgi:saccharopine dehydrogenase-like NADP-dependent oxidoreductase
MKACIFGIGDMGLAAAWAMKRLGFELQLIEDNIKRFDEIETLLGTRPIRPSQIMSLGENIEEDCDVVISCLPFLLTEHVANDCAKLGVPYCDLGGNPEVSERISKLGNQIAVFTDLGLAPGYLNILAEQAYAEDPSTENIHMFCGGLPSEKMENSLNYARVFHVNGLTNEYTGECDIIKNGKIEQVKALDGEKHIRFGDEIFEAFYTKGCTNVSLDSMMSKGIKNFDYRTVRYQGHVDLLKFLMRECRIIGPDFSEAIMNACPKTTKDWLYIGINTDDLEMTKIIHHDNQWTAMQKGTSFPAAAVAAIMAKNKDPKVWAYSDVPFDEFNDNLNEICGSEIKSFS